MQSLHPAPIFLSTLSVRRATWAASADYVHSKFLSTLSVRRATLTVTIWKLKVIFLSTLSVRRATAGG